MSLVRASHGLADRASIAAAPGELGAVVLAPRTLGASRLVDDLCTPLEVTPDTTRERRTR